MHPYDPERAQRIRDAARLRAVQLREQAIDRLWRRLLASFSWRTRERAASAAAAPGRARATA